MSEGKVMCELMLEGEGERKVIHERKDKGGKVDEGK